MTSQTDPFAALERNYSAEDHFDRDPQSLGSIQPTADRLGNRYAREGCDRCECGCKYWEGDVCIDCRRPFAGRSCEECGTPSGRPCPSYCSTVTPED